MSNFRIIQIDDDPVMISIVEATLSRDRLFTVRSCQSGEEGISACADWRPDLIMCDVQMPTMDGREVLARLRENPSTREIPFIFSTGWAPPEEVAELLSLGAAAVIAKPFNLSDLARTLCSQLKIADIAAPEIEIAPGPYDFRARMRDDAARFELSKRSLASGSIEQDDIRSRAHKLAGTAAIYGFQAVSAAAGTVEDTIFDWRTHGGPVEEVLAAIDLLLHCINDEVGTHSVLDAQQAI